MIILTSPSIISKIFNNFVSNFDFLDCIEVFLYQELKTAVRSYVPCVGVCIVALVCYRGSEGFEGELTVFTIVFTLFMCEDCMQSIYVYFGLRVVYYIGYIRFEGSK